MPIITLTTDFGQRDPYVGIMKGVILGILPTAQLVDLTHEIEPQNVQQAACVLSRSVSYFPVGTVHLAVIDPGVGSRRRPLLARTARAAYVGPDNGLFSASLVEPGAQAWELDRPEYWLPHVSLTFHGRDIFAPVAAHLARGIPHEQLGRPISDPVCLPLPQPIRHADGRISGRLVDVDRFGNLISDVPATWVSSGRWHCRVAGHQVVGPSRSYSDVAPGEMVMLISSSDTVEIALRNGNAAQRLSVGIGETVVLWKEDS